jgi:hypothetical protein
MTFFLAIKILHRNKRFKNNLPFVVVVVGRSWPLTVKH